MEATERNQTALKDPDDGLPSNRRKGGCLDERMCCSNDFDPVLKSRVSSEGDQVTMNANKGKDLLWDELWFLQIHNPA